MQSCATCCGAQEAEAVLLGQNDIDEYWKQLHKLGKDGMLPDLEAQLQYYVYTIQAGGICGHKSVVLSSNKTHFVTVELGFYHKNGIRHVSPVTQALKKEHHSKLTYHGAVVKTGHQLIQTALDVMEKFGRYNRVCRNCHHYCEMFIKANGL